MILFRCCILFCELTYVLLVRLKWRVCCCSVTVLSLLMISCSFDDSIDKRKDSPLHVVIKLLSAESVGNFEEAKKYIDIEKVFSKDPSYNNRNADSIWSEYKEYIQSMGSLTDRSGKFTNCFLYYQYDISEYGRGDQFFVEFRQNDRFARKRILYTLQYVDKKLKVVNIAHYAE